MNEKHSKTHSDDSNRGRSRNDWAPLPALPRERGKAGRGADDETAAAVASDPDAAPPDIDWSQAVLVVPPKKKAISIRVDPDVLEYFKNEGPGYQRRINAVLRSYVEQKQKHGKSG
jgi:uncharacterized protein (DUF4415 family)